MKSLSELSMQLGLSHAGRSGAPNGWQLLNQLRAEGCVVVVKLDGQRPQNCYTVVISDGPLGENYFRKDGDDLDELIKEGANFYDSLIWKGRVAPVSPSSPPRDGD